VPDTLDPLPDWQGRILVDATNPFVASDPLQLADLRGRTASVVVAEHAPGARVVKAFNSITMANFEKGPRQGDARRVLFVSGDDVASKQTVQRLITDSAIRPSISAASTTVAACNSLAGHWLARTFWSTNDKS
jgi:predicted dinucleotide-binding enzyme